jgi:hypothetical protein
VRLFFRRRVPHFERVLLIESGSRFLMEKFLPILRERHGEKLQRIDLVTCFSGIPKGFHPDHGAVFRVSDYPNAAARKRLYRELAGNRYSVAVAICSGEPIMTKWKWVLGARVPAKFLVLNENGDYFFLDWGHWSTIQHFLLFRAGLSGADAVPTLVRLALLPFSIVYLLLYAAAVHTRAAFRSSGAGTQT